MSKVKKEQGEIRANVLIKQLALDQLFNWSMKMIVGKELEIAHKRYTVKMVFNEERYLDKISKIKKESRLLVAEQKEEIKEIERSMKEDREQCPEIKFVAIVSQLKYGFGKTEILISVPDDIIETINQHKQYLSDHYVVKLIPLEGEIKDE